MAAATTTRDKTPPRSRRSAAAVVDKLHGAASRVKSKCSFSHPPHGRVSLLPAQREPSPPSTDPWAGGLARRLTVFWRCSSVGESLSSLNTGWVAGEPNCWQSYLAGFACFTPCAW